MLKAVTISEPKVEGGQILDVQGRSFEGVLVAAVEKAGEKSPIYAAFAVSEGQYKPFWANLRTGGEVQLVGMDESYRRGNKDRTMVFPAKEGAIWVPAQRTKHGHLLQIYNPRYFNFTRGRVNSNVEFCMMPRIDRLDLEQERAGQNRPSIEKHFARLGALFDESQGQAQSSYGYAYSYKTTRQGFDEQAAYCKPFSTITSDSEEWDHLEARSELLCAILLQRSGLPIPEDPRFFAQVFVGMRDRRILLRAQDVATLTTVGIGEPDIGLTEPIICHVVMETLMEFLAAQVKFYEAVIK